VTSPRPENPRRKNRTGRVVVVGSVNVDLVVTVPQLPRPGETVAGGTFSRGGGGKGGNQAAAAARLGAETAFVGLVGDDDFGRSARADLERAGVATVGLGVAASPTGVAAILVDGHGENCIAVASGANADLGPEQVEAAFAGLGDAYAVVVTSFEIPEAAVRAAARLAGERGWGLVVNPAPARPVAPDVLAATTVLTPNEHEVGELAPDPTALLRAGVGAVAVTQGGAGVDVWTAGGQWHQPAFPAQVVDTTGAGDAFTAAAATALARGLDLRAAVRFAAAAGALATQAPGARGGLATTQEVLALLAGS